MNIDETSLHNGELYTIITNKDAKGKKGILAAIIKGTKSSLVSQGICNQLSAKELFSVKEITLDLANSMDWICNICFPNAIKTGDRFHFQKVVSEGVQEIRIKLRREAIDKENEIIVEAKKERRKYTPKRFTNGDTEKQLLARSRHLLFKTKNKWTKTQSKRAEILFEEYSELEKAYKFSMYFRNIFEAKIKREEAKERLDKWYEKISRSSIPTLISSANTIKNNEGKILNYFHSRSTNASAESFNAKIKSFRSLLRGVRDINFFLFRLEKLYA